MNDPTCTLCDLPLRGSPVTEAGVDGKFCCPGCLQVYKLLEDMEDDRAGELRKSARRKNSASSVTTPLPDSSEEAYLRIDGMHCSTCESFLETLAGRSEGIYRGEASYASEMIKVYYDPDRLGRDELPGIFSRMGYSARAMEQGNEEQQQNTIARLVIGGFFSIIGLLIYVLFLYPTYLGGEGIVPLTDTEILFFTSNILVMTTFVLVYTGYPILRGAWVSISVFRPNMDLLISIAAVSAYCYSVGALIAGSAEVYFDVTMAIVMVVSIGNYYEQKIKTGKNKLLEELTDRRIRQARVQRNGRYELADIEELQPGDRVMIKAGERIPVDGKIREGEGVVNEALITGEPIPVHKRPGDPVTSGTLLTQHSLVITTGTEVQSTLENLVRLMWDIQAGRHGKQHLADRIASYFVPAVLLIGFATFLFHYYRSGSPADSLLAALAVLIVSCPCALGLATPLAIASGLREALKRNIIIKTGALFEEDAEPAIVAFDKTGTLTTGKMQLLDRGTDERALAYARAIEQYASHPTGQAIAGADLPDRNLSVTNFKSWTPGVGATIDGKQIYVGQPEWLEENRLLLSDAQRSIIRAARKQAHIPIGIGWDGEVVSIVTVGDRVRPESAAIVAALRQKGRKVAVITGDSDLASKTLQENLQPDFLFTGTRPESKTEIIRNLKKFGVLAMVGDGSNDAPALAEADLGIAFGDLTAIAAESAQVVIPGQRLNRVLSTFRTIDLTKARIRQNLAWAFLYNITTIPLAVTGLINPLFAALAMAGSSLLVVSNSSRSMNLEVEPKETPDG